MPIWYFCFCFPVENINTLFYYSKFWTLFILEQFTTPCHLGYYPDVIYGTFCWSTNFLRIKNYPCGFEFPVLIGFTLGSIPQGIRFVMVLTYSKLFIVNFLSSCLLWFQSVSSAGNWRGCNDLFKFLACTMKMEVQWLPLHFHLSILWLSFKWILIATQDEQVEECFQIERILAPPPPVYICNME